MHKKILVVEDEQAIRTYLKILLTGLGFEVIMANDGREALAIASSTNPDLILSDIDMPNLDGIEFAESLTSDTPVIFMTGNPDKNRIRIAAMKRKTAFLLKKPFTKEKLQAAIEQHINT